LPSLKAAICGGADSVYLGMGKFNARDNAVNFNEEYFSDAVKLAKSNMSRSTSR
jgi:putative protease